MRKKAVLSVIMASLLLLSACGGSDAAADASAPSDSAEEAETSEDEAAADDASAAESDAEAKVSRDAGGLGGDDSDLPYYMGPWKFDEYAIYLYLGEDYRWDSYNAKGEITYSGDYYDNGDTLLMEYDDGSPDDEYTIEDTGLVSQDGNTCSKVDHMIFLPSVDDSFDETYYFDTAFKDVSVNYPESLTPNKREGMTDTVLFTPTLGAGTGDRRCSIQITHEQLLGSQKKMQCGSGPAKPCMVNLLNNVLADHYSDYLLKVISTDFKDCGTYYSITGYTWFDSSIFPTDDGTPFRGVCQMRYYGPTGYFVAVICIGTPERIEEYYELSQKIMDTYSYKSDWTTSPKEVPSKPGKASSGSSGSAYYWTDADGDIWYWNGSYNEFVSFGSNGYIDDGEYYESNDAGWTTDDEYYESNDAGWSSDYYDDYDIYSDPGDGYDTWSDSGDYYDTSGWDDY